MDWTKVGTIFFVCFLAVMIFAGIYGNVNLSFGRWLKSTTEVNRRAEIYNRFLIAGIFLFGLAAFFWYLGKSQ